MFPSDRRTCPPGIVLLLSVRSGDARRTTSLLRAGVRPDATRDARGNTALHIAAAYGHAEIARTLIEAGASTETLTPGDRFTPLRLAAERGHLCNVQVLLNASADMDAQDQLDRATPLHAAAEAGHTSVVRELARRGANLEARASSGQTPLRWALSLGRAETATALLQLGADPDAPDRLGACCLHAVAGFRSEGCSGVRSAFAHTSPFPAWSPAAMAELLLSFGASVNQASGQARASFTPSLSEATTPEAGNGPARDEGAGDGVSRVSCAGETPLHIAARESSVWVAKLLLQSGSDPNAKTSAEEGGFSPLHSAAAPGCDNSRLVVRVLLEAGADIDVVAADGVTTPLRLACQNATVGCVEELLHWGAHDLSLAPPSPKFHSLQNPSPPEEANVSHSPRPPPGSHHVIALPSVGAHVEDGHPLSGVEEVAAYSSSSAAYDIDVSPFVPPPLAAVVGSRVPLSAKDVAEENYIRELLRKAPFERAWRRRGWLVMLYARAVLARRDSSDEIFLSSNSMACAGVRRRGQQRAQRGAVVYGCDRVSMGVAEAEECGGRRASPGTLAEPAVGRIPGLKKYKIRGSFASCNRGDGDLRPTNVFAGCTESRREARPDEDVRGLVRLLVEIQGDQAVFRSVVLWL